MTDNSIVETRTAGGIPVLTEAVPSSASAAFLIAVRTGSRDEVPSIFGLSHLLEHTVFRETKTMDSFEMAKLMEGSGGMLNAFTAKEMTGFYGVTLRETADVARRCVADIVANPLINEKDTELEKKIVLQELNMVKSEPEEYVHDLFESDIWQGDALGQDEGGREEVVRGLTHEDLRKYYGERYGRPNLAVFATGGTDSGSVTEWAEGSLDGMSAPVVNDRRAPKVHPAGFHYHAHASDQVQVAFGFPFGKLDTKRRMAASVMSAVLGAGTSSRLFQSVREKKALVYSIYDVAESYSDAGYSAAFLSCTDRNVGEALRQTAATVSGFRKEGVGKDELRRTKNLLKGEVARSSESTGRRIFEMCQRYMAHGEYRSTAETLALIDSVTEDDVMAAAQSILDADRLCVTVLGQCSKENQEFDLGSLDI